MPMYLYYWNTWLKGSLGCVQYCYRRNNIQGTRKPGCTGGTFKSFPFLCKIWNFPLSSLFRTAVPLLLYKKSTSIVRKGLICYWKKYPFVKKFKWRFAETRTPNRKLSNTGIDVADRTKGIVFVVLRWYCGLHPQIKWKSHVPCTLPRTRLSNQIESSFAASWYIPHYTW